MSRHPNDGDYEVFAASTGGFVDIDGQTGKGAKSDVIRAVTFTPITLLPGAIQLRDSSGGSAMTIFVGAIGAAGLNSEMRPVTVDFGPNGIRSQDGPWQIDNGGNLTTVVDFGSEEFEITDYDYAGPSTGGFVPINGLGAGLAGDVLGSLTMIPVGGSYQNPGTIQLRDGTAGTPFTVYLGSVGSAAFLVEAKPTTNIFYGRRAQNPGGWFISIASNVSVLVGGCRFK